MVVLVCLTPCWFLRTGCCVVGSDKCLLCVVSFIVALTRCCLLFLMVCFLTLNFVVIYFTSSVLCRRSSADFNLSIVVAFVYRGTFAGLLCFRVTIGLFSCWSLGTTFASFNVDGVRCIICSLLWSCVMRHFLCIIWRQLFVRYLYWWGCELAWFVVEVWVGSRQMICGISTGVNGFGYCCFYQIAVWGGSEKCR